MATDLENLYARRSAILAELAAIDPTKAGGKPNNASGVDHQGYKAGLYAELEKIQTLIDQLELEADGDPFEYVSRGVT